MAKLGRLLAGGVCAVVLAAVVAVVPVVVPSVAAAAGPGECQVVGPDGKCVVVTDPQEPGPGGGPVGGGTWSCLWTGPLDSAVGRAVWPEAPPEASYWLWRDCGSGGGNRQYDRWERV